MQPAGIGGGPEDEEWFLRLPPEVQTALRDPKAWKGSGAEFVIEQSGGSRGSAAAEAAGGVLYSFLQPRVQVVVRPYLDSKFTLEDVGAGRGGGAAGAATDPSSSSVVIPSSVIFGRQRHSFRRWLELWLKAMSRMISGQHQVAFHAVTSVLKWDLPLMMFLLPQV